MIRCRVDSMSEDSSADSVKIVDSSRLDKKKKKKKHKHKSDRCVKYLLNVFKFTVCQHLQCMCRLF